METVNKMEKENSDHTNSMVAHMTGGNRNETRYHNKSRKKEKITKTNEDATEETVNVLQSKAHQIEEIGNKTLENSKRQK